MKSKSPSKKEKKKQLAESLPIKEASGYSSGSGSDNEIERKVILLKGDITMPRPSLLDIFATNSWIKMSNFEGIFNLVIVVLIMCFI